MNELEHYSQDEIRLAYERWVNVPHEHTDERLLAWYRYVDARDGLPPGTTRISAEREIPKRSDARVIWMDLDG